MCTRVRNIVRARANLRMRTRRGLEIARLDVLSMFFVHFIKEITSLTVHFHLEFFSKTSRAGTTQVSYTVLKP